MLPRIYSSSVYRESIVKLSYIYKQKLELHVDWCFLLFFFFLFLEEKCRLSVFIVNSTLCIIMFLSGCKKVALNELTLTTRLKILHFIAFWFHRKIYYKDLHLVQWRIVQGFRKIRLRIYRRTSKFNFYGGQFFIRESLVIKKVDSIFEAFLMYLYEKIDIKYRFIVSWKPNKYVQVHNII